MQNSETSTPRTTSPWRTWQDFIFASSHILAAVESDLQNPPTGEYAMSLSDFDILATLYHCPTHEQPLCQLKDTVLVTTSGLSRSVSRLVERGWISKTQSPEDKRKYSLALTDAGTAALLAAQEHHAVAVERLFFSAFDGADMRDLHRLTAQLVSHLREQ